MQKEREPGVETNYMLIALIHVIDMQNTYDSIVLGGQQRRIRCTMSSIHSWGNVVVIFIDTTLNAMAKAGSLQKGSSLEFSLI